MSIKTITFDWGDTLATNHGQPYGHSQRRGLDHLAEALSQCGGNPSLDWQSACHAELHQAWVDSANPEKNPDNREFDMAAMVNGWATNADCDPNAPSVRQALNTFLDDAIDTVLAYDGISETLSELKQRGYRIGILSHVAFPGDSCRRWFARRGWDKYLDFYSLSSDVGWIKPRPEHYQHALDQAQCEPHELLHVGDHPLRDVIGGRGYGFATCLRLTEGIYDNDLITNCQPDIAVIHIRELLDHCPSLS